MGEGGGVINCTPLGPDDDVDEDGFTPKQGDCEDGFHFGHGFLDRWGTNVDVRKGERMLVVSSGSARQPADLGYQSPNNYDKHYESGHPMGFPKESPACPGVVTGTPHDSTGVELTLRAPSNAAGISFDFNFYTYEWPGFVCSPYNDFFVAILDPIPMGQTDGNISFDSQGNPVSVNNALLRVCGCYEQDMDPFATCEAGGKIFECDLGNLELVGTGFGFDTEGEHNHHGATSWLRTQAPIPPGGEIKVRFATYDSNDGILNSTTLVDNFQWILKPGVMVGTNPVPQ